MDWDKLCSSKRRNNHGTRSNGRLGRTEFASDVDRVTFSSSFRRLARKTQVHPLAANDHIHTRLTHSLEVSRVGRALGHAVGVYLQQEHLLPTDVGPNDIATIVEAACLAHDLGNPPFGHAGEEAIIHWFDQNGPEIFPGTMKATWRHDLSSMEGNAQGFRIVTQLESRLFEGGLDLTYATLGAFQKYPISSESGMKKFGAYISEKEILEEIGTHLGLPVAPHGFARHPLAFLVEAADDICYAVLDIEDAVEMRILRFNEAADVLLAPFDKAERVSIRQSFPDPAMHRVNFSRIRGPLFDKMIGSAVDSFRKHYGAIMNGAQAEGLLEGNDACSMTIGEAKKLSRSNIFTDSKKVEIEIGCYAVFDTLLSAFISAAIDKARVIASPDGSVLSWKSSSVLKLLGDHAPGAAKAPTSGWTEYECIRRVIDFVDGMTDNYAVYLAKQLQGNGFSGGQRP